MFFIPFLHYTVGRNKHIVIIHASKSILNSHITLFSNTFNNHILLIKRLQPGEQTTQVTRNRLGLLVQVYDLPIGFMSEKVAKAIGNNIGVLYESDPKNFDGLAKTFMRLNASIDIGKPIARKMKIKMEGGRWIWIR